MKNAIILHGKPSKEGYYDKSRQSQSNEHWLPWLQHELLLKDILAQTPEMPKPYDPIYEDWARIIEQFEVGPETIIVGHSCGGGFWLKYLSLHRELKVGNVVLVSPSLGLSWGDGGEHFFDDFKIDPDLPKRTRRFTIITSDNDGEGIVQAIKETRTVIKDLNYLEIPGQGHFTYRDMKTNKFSELLEECLAGNT